ncbi:NAD(P)H-hydrate dehydratase [Motiliproteus sp.]|uniref:NAD(P)H-hydrate dehydratase n=1 Tax=Motiliproteus sp. TaxID=1898955 RepID=UPI003BAABAAD
MPFSPPENGLGLYRAEQTRELDRCAIQDQGIDGFELMKRAGRAAYRALRQHWPDVRRLTLISGSGNNGGDALVVAAMALEQQLEVQMLLVGGESTRAKLQGEARQALEWAEQRGVKVRAYDPDEAFSGELIVDGLLGTGLSGEVRGDYRSLIERINASGLPVLALDIPSGLCADTGAELGVAIRAQLTISFIGLNRGLLTHRGPACCGRVLFDTLSVPDEVYQAIPTGVRVIGPSLLSRCLGPRDRTAHKGSFGHVMVIGGDHGMAGAVLMSSEAALRSGSGLVSVVTRPEHVALCTGHRPEVMTHGVDSGQDLEPLIERASVIAIGPGLGKNAWSGQLLRVAQAQPVPLVIDADGLNLLAEGQLIEPQARDNWVLTPHPGEAARLLGCSVAQIQADRFDAVNQIQQRYGGVVVLKGAGTLVSDGASIRLCCRGNPGMASGGMGDVLSGVIAALMAQGLNPFDAASVAVEVHGHAADLLAAKAGERGLAATDLMAPIRRLLNPSLMLQLESKEQVFFEGING